MDSLFFVASKVIWSVVRPDHLLLLLLSIAWWRLRHACGRDGRRLSVKGFSIALFSLWLIALYPLGHWLLYPLETRFAQKPVRAEQLAGVVVLGGGESVARSEHWQRLELNEGGDRYLELMALAQLYPDLPIIFTGGSGRLGGNDFGAADALLIFLKRLDMDQRVVLESASRNTWENALYSRTLAEPIENASGKKRWLLVTSAFHMPRAVGLFRQTGWQVEPWPVDYRSRNPEGQRMIFDLQGNLEGLAIGGREWLGLVAYWLSGKTDQLLPGRSGAYLTGVDDAN